MTAQSKQRIEPYEYNAYVRQLEDNLRQTLRLAGCLSEGVIIGIARGGLIPAVYMSHAFNLPLRMFQVESYHDRTRGHLQAVGSFPELPRYADMLPNYVVLVDDLIDSGETIRFAVDQLLWTYSRPGQLNRLVTLVVATVINKGAVDDLQTLLPNSTDLRIVHGTKKRLDGWLTFPYEVD